MKQQYMVFHRLMRDAQIYAEDSRGDGFDPHDEGNEKKWKDFQQDPLMEIIFAKSEEEAVAKVGKAYGIHVSNMYAKPVRLSVGAVLQIPGSKHRFHFEAASFIGKNKSGIDITLPDGRTAIVAMDHETGQMSLTVRNEDGEEKVIEF